MENIKYLKKIILPEIKRYNFKTNRSLELNGFAFANGKNSDVKFKKGQVLSEIASPSLKEIFAIIYSYIDLDTTYHSAIIDANSITLIGFRCYDENSNDYIDPDIEIDDFGIVLSNESSAIDFVGVNGDDSNSKQKLVDRINKQIQLFIRCNITKEDEQKFLDDLQKYNDSLTI